MAILSALLKIRAAISGLTDVERLGGAIGATQKATDSLQRSFSGLAGIMATGVIGAVVGNLMEAGLAAQGTTTRIKALAAQYGEVAKVEELAGRAAARFGLGTTEARNAVADLYGRLRPMNVSLKEIETVFFGVNKAAKVAGLGAADVSGVMLQLSQALGSGRLQGDELRSIMERMPAVGQAVAKVMGVSAAEIKKLGSEGKITTDVMIKAAAVLNQIKAPPPTSMQQYTQAMENLRTELGENLVPILTPFIVKMTELVRVFAALPEPVQTGIVGLALLTTSLIALSTAITVIGPGFVALTTAIAGLAIGAKIAGIATVIQVAFSGLLAWFTATFLPTILAIFSGPAGWTVLAIAAVVAMVVAFRKPITDFLKWVGDGMRNAALAIGNGIKDIFNGMLRGIIGYVNSAISAINILIRAFNRLPGPDLPLVPRLQVPQFADGGVVNRPTLAMVGEGGEPEYIVPASRMAAASQAYLSGARGAAVLQGRGGGTGPLQIAIQTGPVLRAEGQDWVTTSDLERAMRQTAEAILGRQRTPAGRRAMGIA